MRRILCFLMALSVYVGPCLAAPRVLVSDFEHRSFEPQLEWVGTGLAYLIRRDLGTLEGVEVLYDRRRRDEARSQPADWLVLGEVRDAGGKLIVSLVLERPGSEQEDKQLLTEGEPRDLFLMAGYITERIARHLGLSYGQAQRQALGLGLTGDIQAFRLFSEALIERRPRRKLELYQQALEFDPGFAEAYQHVSRMQTLLGDYAAAQQALEKLVGLRPDTASVHNDLAYVLAQQGEYDQALERYRQAARLEPNDARYQLNQAQLLRAMGRREAAVAALRAALERDPELTEARVALIELGAAEAPVQVASAGQQPTPRSAPKRPAPVARPTPAATPTPAPARASQVERPAPTRSTPAPTPRPSATPVARPEARITVRPPAPGTPPVVLPKQVQVELESASEAVAGERDAALREQLQTRLQGARQAFAAGRMGQGYVALGRLYLDAGLKHAAVDLFERGVAAEPGSIEAHRALGDAYLLIGKDKQAREQLRLAGVEDAG